MGKRGIKRFTVREATSRKTREVAHPLLDCAGLSTSDILPGGRCGPPAPLWFRSRLRDSVGGSYSEEFCFPLE